MANEGGKELLAMWADFRVGSLPSTNPARDRMLRSRHDARIQDEAHLASQIQAQVPGATRGEALRVASRILDRERSA